VRAKGLFITIEGPEGSGKTTQASLLRERLESLGQSVVCVREPGGTVLGEKIRELLLGADDDPMSPEAELMLFLSARAQLVSLVIEPALCSGKIMICDRYSDSTVAYQAFGRGLDRDAVESANRIASGSLVPDLTILLDVDVAVGLSRVRTPNRFDAETEEFHRRVRSGFLAIASEEPDRVKIVDASRTEGEVAQDVWRIVEGAVSGSAEAKEGIRR
jgi:dTMP kinase